MLFMLDSGATVNVVKLTSLNRDAQVQEGNALKIGGITPGAMNTLGTVTLTIKGAPYTFHVVPGNFPILEDAVIGRCLMKLRGAIMSYYYNALVIDDVMEPIPFLTKEERKFHIDRKRNVPRSQTDYVRDVHYIVEDNTTDVQRAELMNQPQMPLPENTVEPQLNVSQIHSTPVISNEQDYFTDIDVSDEEPVIFGSHLKVPEESETIKVLALSEVKNEGRGEKGQVSGKGEKPPLRICTWNVAGLRSVIKKGGFSFFTENKLDIIALQEIKCPEDRIPASAHLPEYYCYFSPGQKKGYAGVAIFTRFKPLKVHQGIGNAEFDVEGRTLTVEFPECYVVNAYVPTSGENLVSLDKRLRWNECFKKFPCDLDYKKAVILCSDLNVAHMEIDLAQPKQNIGKAAFTTDERYDMTSLLLSGFVDAFRFLYPRKKQYTFWQFGKNHRERNIGWRLDYFLISERWKGKIADAEIHEQVGGSDHCPVTLTLPLDHSWEEKTISSLLDFDEKAEQPGEKWQRSDSMIVHPSGS